MGYMEDYEDYITPDPVDYEVYQSMVEKKDAEIEKLQYKLCESEDDNENLKKEIELYKTTLKVFKDEVKRYEDIQRNIQNKKI